MAMSHRPVKADIAGIEYLSNFSKTVFLPFDQGSLSFETVNSLHLIIYTIF